MTKKAAKDQLLEMYRQMWRVRKLEDIVYQLYSEGTVPGAVHISHGQEAIAVGVIRNLKEEDYVVTTHRGHGHTLMKGADMKGMMAELLGRQTGFCKGLGGSMHIADASKGIIGANGIVASGIPIALGAAFSSKYRGTDQVTVCFFGDAASNAGSFHESLNMAANWKLPIVYVCENNGYGMSVSAKNSVSIENIADRASAYGIPGTIADGMNVIEVNTVAAEAIEKARSGEGPQLLELKTYRYKGHSRGDKPYGTYRTKEEWDSWQARDPLKALEKELALKDDEIKEILQLIDQEIAEAVDFAKNSPVLPEEQVLNYVYA